LETQFPNHSSHEHNNVRGNSNGVSDNDKVLQTFYDSGTVSGMLLERGACVIVAGADGTKEKPQKTSPRDNSDGNLSVVQVGISRN
jgi:hypothetical protein